MNKEGKKIKTGDKNMPSQIAEQTTAELEPDVPIKKKRGRKKKIKTPEEIEREKNKPKQRRGRKPKSHMIVNKRDISEFINKKDKEETIILNLKVNKDILQEKDDKELIEQFNCNNELEYTPSINYPIGYDNANAFTSLPSNVLNKNNNNNNTNNTNNNNININNNNINNNINTINTINNYNNINNNINNDTNNNTIVYSNPEKNESLQRKNIYSSLEGFIDNPNWKNKTNVYCWWCCHVFDNIPFGIPIKYKDEKFHVSGCFCSLECASSYNFNDNNGVQDVWECYSLINLLSQKIGYKDIVKLAPHKVCLKIFGGKLNIDEFRNMTNKNKIINVLDYPMLPTNQQLEEINYNTSNNMNNFIPIDENRIKRIEQKIKLSRNKPLNNNKNTLEHTMNIKISN